MQNRKRCHLSPRSLDRVGVAVHEMAAQTMETNRTDIVRNSWLYEIERWIRHVDHAIITAECQMIL